MLTDADLSKIGKLVQKELTPVKKDLKSLRSDVLYVKKTIDLMIKMFDRDHFELKRRVEAIEEHLGISLNK